MNALLEVEDLAVAYGKINAVKGITLSVTEGELVSLIGTNGAGKSTTLRTISGLLPPVTGQIRFDGQRIDQMPAHRIVQRGVAHVPEGRHIFGRMTVEENLMLGAYTRREKNLTAERDRVYELFPVLAERRKQAAGTFSGGEQQMLAIGRALMSAPRLLMLDEPSMGLSPIMMNRITETLQRLRENGTTILLVEQNAQAALELADYGHVLEVGRIVLSDTGDALLANPKVRKSYLGED